MARLASTIVGRAELVAPWGLEVDPLSEASVHVVQRGRCFLRIAGQVDPIELREGDLALIAHGVGHSVSDHPARTPEPYVAALARIATRVSKLSAAAREQTTLVLCAKYLLEQRGPHPLLALLPPLIVVRAHDVAGRPQIGLLLQLMRLELAGSDRGAELVLPRLLDTLLVFVMRVWLEEQQEGSSWFGALRDPAVTKALAAIHERPDRPWSVAMLAKHVAQSRATFARRFHELVGETPHAYLIRWRMCVASKLLRDSELRLDQIAIDVGYETAAAFSKAFKLTYGLSPGRFRAAPNVRGQQVVSSAPRQESAARLELVRPTL
ncbi:MAG: Transcriptional regulator, AraC family protein [Myxococcaceae bacterium]|nr:Transcriptional regulator, AraC family protein [Myxococcaceae bacterium]